MRRSIKGLYLAAFALTPILTTAAVDNQNAIDYRQHVMNTLNEQAGALGQILSGAAPDGMTGRCISALLN